MTKEITSTKDIEIRKLPPGAVFKLSNILESGDGWKLLMSGIPDECKEGNPLKYTVEDMKLIESAAKCQERTCSEILLEEWGTSGRCRPKLSDLVKFLIKAELYRAAEFVAVDLLKGKLPPKPNVGPAAPVEYTFDSIDANVNPSAPPAAASPTLSQKSRQLTVGDNELNPVEGVVQFSYEELERATLGWSESRVVGNGAWGCVYKARLLKGGPAAIKRLHLNSSLPPIGDPVTQFHNEVKVLAQLSHPNLLPLLGYSVDGPALCIAYQYMHNGSLLDRLDNKSCHLPLPWLNRMEIALGSAKGLAHLHTALPKPLVHRDVKSANILLGDNMVPKLGDFGLVRLGSSGDHTRTAAVTTNVIGTAAYMAPEAQRGDVSVKIDIFSYGVVLLELLTGLPPYEENRDGRDLITFVENEDYSLELVDDNAKWPAVVAKNTMDLAMNCIKYNSRQRPPINKVVDELTESLCHNNNEISS